MRITSQLKEVFGRIIQLDPCLHCVIDKHVVVTVGRKDKDILVPIGK